MMRSMKCSESLSCDPPKPRLIVGKSGKNSPSFQPTMLELPTKSTTSRGGGDWRSRASNAAMADSHRSGPAGWVAGCVAGAVDCPAAVATISDRRVAVTHARRVVSRMTEAYRFASPCSVTLRWTNHGQENDPKENGQAAKEQRLREVPAARGRDAQVRHFVRRRARRLPVGRARREGPERQSVRLPRRPVHARRQPVLHRQAHEVAQGRAQTLLRQALRIRAGQTRLGDAEDRPAADAADADEDEELDRGEPRGRRRCPHKKGISTFFK